MLQATSMVVLFISLAQLALILIRAHNWHNSILIQEVIIRNVNINHHIRALVKISELYCISHFKGYSLLTHVSSNQCIMALPKISKQRSRCCWSNFGKDVLRVLLETIKMCLQLLLLLEKDSSFYVVQTLRRDIAFQ